MAGGYRRVRCKDCRLSYLVERCVEALSAFDQLFDSLERRERCVALVEMPHHRLIAQRAQRPNAANTQNDLLLKSCLAISTVKPR